MSYRTVVESSIERYMTYEYDSPDDRAERAERLLRFPYPVMLELAFPELDFANRWCWRHFGPADGECSQEGSEYRTCVVTGAHRHTGKWTFRWFTKTEYDFGFCEWYFTEQSDRDLFIDGLPEINWGENYPK